MSEDNVSVIALEMTSVRRMYQKRKSQMAWKKGFDAEQNAEKGRICETERIENTKMSVEDWPVTRNCGKYFS